MILATRVEATDRAYEMADRWGRIALRNLRALRDLRRYGASVTIQNAGQVNLGGQQVNVAARGVEEAAEKVYVAAKDAKPTDVNTYIQLAGYYNRQGRFDKTIEALEERAQKEPNNPEAFYTIATYYWDEAYRDFKLKDAEKRDFVAKGMTAVDHALQLKPDYVEAIVYKGLLLRLQANLEKDPAKQQQLLKDATALSEKANAMRKAKTAGAAP